MKKFAILILLLVMSIVATAQTKPIEFMGIPVEGSVASMERKLKQKGFNKIESHNCFVGQFNDQHVEVHIVESHEKVWRLAICYYISDNQYQIKANFNKLFIQFNTSSRYLFTMGDKIPADEYLYPQKVESQVYKFTAFPKVDYYGYVWCSVFSGENEDEYEIWLYYNNTKDQPKGQEL